MQNKTGRSNKSIIAELKKVKVFSDLSDEDLIKIEESLRQFSTILFDLYKKNKSAKNEY